jgi:polysaccharide biosynthesis/export protein
MQFFHTRAVFVESVIKIITLLWGMSLFSGCVNSKQLAYFQDVQSRIDSLRAQPFVVTIQPGDLLSIQVSSLNPEASLFFNPFPNQVIQNNNQNTTPLPVNTGYLVASDSTISIPLIGKLKLVGKTPAEASDYIQTRLKNYLKEPTVNLRNLNYRITVLGEVTRPSLFNITNDRITLPESLGLAGDLTIYGRRDNVLVVREENGLRISARLDLTKADVFQSPYYYLHPNDIVYVEPGKSRIASTDRIYQVVPIILSALSFIAIIFTRR